MRHYNPLTDGHVERVGRTKVGNRHIYVVAEPEHPAALEYLERWKFVRGKWTTTDGRTVSGWVRNPPEAEPEPEAAPKPAPAHPCSKCGAEGALFDSDPEALGMTCACGHLWIVLREAA
jgi:hypothetical protein